MKFRRTPQFRNDFSNLTDSEKSDVNEAFPDVAEALQGNTYLYQKHRIKKMQGWEGIWEGHVKQNLVFTFHYDVDEDGEKICFFRRIGNHSIYTRP